MSPFSLTASALVVAVAYYACPSRFKWLVLLLSSLFLYALNGMQPLLFLLTTMMTTWGGALIIERLGARGKEALRTASPLSRDEKSLMKAACRKRQRAAFIGVLLLNFGLLALLKYAREPAQQALIRLTHGGASRLLVPLGISFYTFQSMGYLIDVYQGKLTAERNPARFALFVSFFPQMVQGPISRYGQLAPQLTTPHRLELTNIRHGLTLILWGFFKKKVIADRAFPFVEAVFADHTPYGGAIIAAAVLLYSLQQYADFSGGIDMITGGAQLLGIQLTPNFKRPYFAVSLGDFWRRWHITLGAWMRDDVFYPFALCKPVTRLAKAAKGHLGAAFSRALPAVMGNLLVFLLVGIWHGASMNYVLWGLYNGAILAASALLEPAYKRFSQRHAQLVSSAGYHVFRVLRTFLIVNIGWYLDRCLDFRDALSMLQRTLTDLRPAQLADGTLFCFGLTKNSFALLFLGTAILFCVSLAQERGIKVHDAMDDLPLPVRWGMLYALIALCILFSVSGQQFSSGFIYAMF